MMLIMMSWEISVMMWVVKWVMDIVVVCNGVFVMMVIVVVVIMVPIMVFTVLWVLSIDEMWLAMFGFISFMNGLWVDMVVVVVEESMFSVVKTMVSIMVVVIMVSIESICEWVVVDGFVIIMVIIVVIVSMVSSEMVVSMMVIMMVSMMVSMMVIMSLFMIVVLSVDGSEFFVVVVVDVVTIVAKSMVAITESMAITISVLRVSEMVTEVCSPFTVVSVSESMFSKVSEWSGFVVCTGPPISVVWGLVVGSTPVSSFMSVVLTIMRKDVTNSHIISIVVGVLLSKMVSVVSLGVLHLLSVSSDVVMIMWVWELMWVDFERSLVMFWINDANVGSVMEFIMMSESISVVLSMSGMVEIMSINTMAIMSICEMWLFVKAVLNLVAIISVSSMFTMWILVVAVVAKVVTETMVSHEHWV
jgi:protein kinase X